MKKLFLLFFLLPSASFALCEYPYIPSVPDGARSSPQQFQMGYQEVSQWIANMSDYIRCIDNDTIEMISMLKITQQHTPKAETTIVELQNKKYNAAVEEQHRVAEQLNAEVRIYKSRQNQQTYQQPRQQNSQSEGFNRAMKAIGDTFSTNPKPTKICNFKSREGAIISGDCEEWRITINGVRYNRLEQ